MKKNSLGFIKIIIFVFGLTAIAILAIVLKDLGENRTGEYIFAVFCVALVYSAVFCPLVFNGAGGDLAGKVVGGVIYYRGAFIYLVITAADVVCVFSILPLGAAIVIECVAIFAFLIYFYLSFFTTKHIQDVKRSEKAALSGVAELRKLSQTLISETSGLGGDCGDIRKELEKINENMRYLSPGETAEAKELEKRMSALLSMIHYDAFITSRGNAPKQNVESYLRDFDVLYRQRKSILK